MGIGSAIRSRRWLQSLSALVFIAIGCAEPPPTPLPIPPGAARIWFYRSYEITESRNIAAIDVNGSYVGAVANGTAFYRDVPPGHYHIAPESYGRDINQDQQVDLGPGQQIYVKIVSLRSWVEGNRIFERDTFYAWLIPPETAEAEIARAALGI